MSTKVVIKHYGRVVDGKMLFYNPILWSNQLTVLEGKEYEIIVKERNKRPNSDQHGYYRGGILQTCLESEMFSHLDNKDQIHTLYFAQKFLTHTELVTLPGERYEVKITRSLADISDKEMNEFMNKVAAYIPTYGKEMLRDFFDYWTEMNEGGKKMRFEMQKVFDISRRLKTWSNNNKFKANGNGNKKGFDLEGSKNAIIDYIAKNK